MPSGLIVDLRTAVIMRNGLWIFWVLLAWVGQAAAHSGHGSTTDIHVYADNMKVVIRTSIPLAWARLDHRAPAMADEEGRKTALPLLIAAAPSLVQLTADGTPLEPLTADCMFEVGDHVAFVLVYERPQKWPVELDAGYVKTLGDLDTATVSVFDRTASRFARDLHPLLEKNVSASDSRVSFALEAVAPSPQIKPSESEKVKKSAGGKSVSIAAVLLAFGVAGLLIWLLQRRRGRNE